MIQQPAGTLRGALLSKGAWGQAARSDGGACGASPGPDGLCFWHDPARHQEMVEVRGFVPIGSDWAVGMRSTPPLNARLVIARDSSSDCHDWRHTRVFYRISTVVGDGATTGYGGPTQCLVTTSFRLPGPIKFATHRCPTA